MDENCVPFNHIEGRYTFIIDKSKTHAMNEFHFARLPWELITRTHTISLIFYWNVLRPVTKI